MAKGNIVRWITVKGRRIPIYEDGSMGGFMEGKIHVTKIGETTGGTFNIKEMNKKLAKEKADKEAADKKLSEEANKTFKSADKDIKRAAQAQILEDMGIDRDAALEMIQEKAKVSSERAEEMMDSMDVKKIKELAESKQNIKSRIAEGSKPSLNDIKGYGYDPHDVTGDPTIITADGRSYYKIGDDKWVAHSDSGRALSGSISDKQMAERLSNAKDVKVIPAVKPNKSIKIGDKEVGVSKDPHAAEKIASAKKMVANNESNLAGLRDQLKKHPNDEHTAEIKAVIKKAEGRVKDSKNTLAEREGKSINVGGKKVGVNKAKTPSIRDIVGSDGEYQIGKAYTKSNMMDIAEAAGIPRSKTRKMTVAELRKMMLAMWRKG